MGVLLAFSRVEDLIERKRGCDREAAAAIAQSAAETAAEHQKKEDVRRIWEEKGKPMILQVTKELNYQTSPHEIHLNYIESMPDIMPQHVSMLRLILFINGKRTNKDILFLVDSLGNVSVIQRLSYAENVRCIHVNTINSQEIEGIILDFLDAAIDRPKAWAVPARSMQQRDMGRMMKALH